jgi:hypothetical protein
MLAISMWPGRSSVLAGKPEAIAAAYPKAEAIRPAAGPLI